MGATDAAPEEVGGAAQHAELRAEVAAAMASAGDADRALRSCAEALVARLGAAFARVWLLDDAGATLELRASAGLYTHLDGAHARVPVGALKIGRIAAERRPHLTNDVANDPLVADHAWASREGMVAFAGHPLLVENRLVGVVAVFARKPLTGDDLAALADASALLAQGVERRRAEAELAQTNALLQAVLDQLPHPVWVKDAASRFVRLNPAAARHLGVADPAAALGKTDADFFPASLARTYLTDERSVLETGRPSVDKEEPQGEGEGAAIWLTSTLPLRDADGAVVGLLGTGRDVTAERRAEGERLGHQLSEAARAAAEAAANRLRTLNEVGRLLTAELDQGRLLQAVVDAATELTGAAFGAFFYNAVDERGDGFVLYTLSGVPREAFARFPMPRATAVFGPTFRGDPPVRLADVRADPRFGRNAPYRGMPEGHLPVASYLAVPVVDRSGNVLGGLFFGHPEPGVFDEAAEELAVGLAGHAAVALDNAALVERVRAGEARFRGLFAGVADAILVADEERRYLDANPAAEDLLGYGPGELVGLRVDDVVALGPDWTAAEYDLYRVEGRWRGDLVLRRKDGSEVLVEARASTVHLPTGPVFLSAIRDVSDRRRLEDLRRDYLAMVTHDLRTPLTGVRGYAQLMRRTGEYRETAVAGIIAQADRMQRLIDGLADVVRLEAGRMELRRAPVDLVELARREAAAVRDQAPAHDIGVDAPGGAVVGAWDADRLGQVLQNLLGNAVKHAPQGVPVAVRVEPIGEEARLSVRDEGPGIAVAHLPRLFERFYRAEASGAGGLGLGLYITRMIVEAHGGTIAVESEPGAGSTFIVTLPLG